MLLVKKTLSDELMLVAILFVQDNNNEMMSSIKRYKLQGLKVHHIHYYDEVLMQFLNEMDVKEGDVEVKRVIMVKRNKSRRETFLCLAIFNFNLYLNDFYLKFY